LIEIFMVRPAPCCIKSLPWSDVSFEASAALRILHVWLGSEKKIRLRLVEALLPYPMGHRS
jgi:hypothetical protein